MGVGGRDPILDDHVCRGGKWIEIEAGVTNVLVLSVQEAVILATTA